MKKKFLFLNGPNLNQLGKREPEIYGSTTYAELCEKVKEWGRTHHCEIECFQSNVEGVLIDQLQEMEGECNGVVFNPGGFAHTSVALRDCVASLSIPLVEVHITNIGRRESFREHSYLSEVVPAQVMGFGIAGYLVALDLLHRGFE